MAAFPLLGVSFLEHLLELVLFLAQLCEGLLRGTGFLSTFLSGVEIGFFCSVFPKTTAILSIVRCVCAPMLLAQVTMFLDMFLFFGTLGLSVPGRFVPSSCCAKFSRRKKGWTFRTFPAHIHAR